MTVETLIVGSIAKFNHAQSLFEKLAGIWKNQSNMISFNAVSQAPGAAQVPEIPADNVNMPLLAGDVFHSLRCSLEYIYRAFHLSKIGIAPERLQFPSSRTAIKGALKAELKTLFDCHENTITTLAAANNQDKHRLLLFALPKIEPLFLETIDGNLRFVSKTNSSDWRDASEAQQYELGEGIRPRYVLVIEKHNDQDECYLTLNDLQDLISDLRICLETIRVWIMGTTPHSDTMQPEEN